jgi:hypothetical protein
MKITFTPLAGRIWISGTMNFPKRSLLFATIIAIIVSSFSAVLPVAAEDLCTIPNPKDTAVCYDDFYSGNNILYYDPNAKECVATPGATSGTSGPITGNSNAEKIFNYLVGKGLTAEQAAGVLGNFQQESGFDPAIIQGGAIAGPNYTPVNSVGFGIAQWTFTARQAPLVSLAKSTSRSVIDLSLQLDFLWQELNSTHAHALTTLKAESTPERAAYVFHRDFEGSADSEAAVVMVRGGNARRLYEQFKNLSATADSGDSQNFITDPNDPFANQSSSASAASCATATGSASGVLNADLVSDTFTIFTQCEEAPYGGEWGSQRTPNGNTACDEASIPTSLAMIATNLGDTRTTPTQVIDYYTNNDLWYDGGGSLLESPLAASSRYGIRAETIADKDDLAAYQAVFKKGGLIMAISAGTAPFTSNRHAIVIRGITSDGNFMIANPLSNSMNASPANQPSPEKILTDIRNDTNSVVYAFYKD